jgi:hypothetical protein
LYFQYGYNWDEKRRITVRRITAKFDILFYIAALNSSKQTQQAIAQSP